MDHNKLSSNNGCGGLFMVIGVILAVIISWSNYHSIFWAILHGLLGWLYVLYALLIGVAIV